MLGLVKTSVRRARKRLALYREGWEKGLWPRYRAARTLQASVDDGTFRSLVLRRLTGDRRQELVTMADKVQARTLVSKLAPDLAQLTVYQICQTPAELDPALWPEECVLKPSHGSGAILVITPERKPGLRYDFDAGEVLWAQAHLGMLSPGVDLHRLKRLCHRWLRSDYSYWKPKFPEWAYSKIPPRIIVEEFLEGPSGEPVHEFRVHCFHGVARYARLTSVTNPEKPTLDCLPDGTIVHGGLEGESGNRMAPPTSWTHFAQAVKHAEAVARDMDYVRVDFLIAGASVFFSELTIYPNGGLRDFKPIELSYWLSGIWRGDFSAQLPGHLIGKKIGSK